MPASISQTSRSNAHIGVQVTSELCLAGAAYAWFKFFQQYSNYNDPSSQLSLPVSVSTNSPLVKESYSSIFPLAIATLATLTGLYLRSYARDLAKRNS